MLAIYLSGCGGAEPNTELTSKQQSSQVSIDNIIPEANITKYLPADAEVNSRKVFLTGKPVQEVVVTYWKGFALEGEEIETGAFILQYQPEINSWKRIYHEEEKGYTRTHLKILASGKLLGDEREQVVIGHIEGSHAFLLFYVLSFENGKIISILNDVYKNGELKIKDGDLLVTSGSQGTRYHWNGSNFDESPFIDQPDINSATPSDVIVHYSIGDNNIVSAVPENGSNIKLGIGGKIYLVRDNLGPHERILIPGNIMNPCEDGTIKAANQGNGVLSIIPDGYDWDHALKYVVIVK